MYDEFIKLAVNNLRKRQLRSWLTIIGIVIGVGSIVGLISIANGLENSVTEQFEQFGTDLIFIRAGMLTGPPTPGESGLTTDDLEVVERVIGVEETIPYIYENTEVEFHDEEIIRSVMAYPPDKMDIMFSEQGIEYSSGREINPNEKYAAVLGYLAATDIFEDELRIRNKIKIDEQKFEIVGIIEEIGNEQYDNRIMIPFETGQELFDSGDDLGGIIAIAKDGLDVEEVAAEIKEDLEDSRDKEDVYVATAAQTLEQIQDILGAISLVVASIAAISLIVGAIGIANTTYTAVLERTKEIGIMKSIGATNIHILSLFLIESALIGLIGGILGSVIGTLLAIGFGAAAGTSIGIRLLVRVDPWLMLFGVGFALVIGTVSGFFPARTAAKLRPVDALRYG